MTINRHSILFTQTKHRDFSGNSAMFNAGSTLIPLFCRQYQGGNKLSTGKSHRMDVHAIVLYPEEGKESYVKAISAILQLSD